MQVQMVPEGNANPVRHYLHRTQKPIPPKRHAVAPEESTAYIRETKDLIARRSLYHLLKSYRERLN